MGKKQFALFLLISLGKQATTREAQTWLGTGSYKTIQAGLNQLVEKKLLVSTLSNHKVIYTTSDAGEKYLSGFKRTMCDKCLSLEFVRELYR